MAEFLKFMVISACLLLAILIIVTGRKTYKEDKSATIAWFIADAYAIGLIYTAIKILIGA